MTPGQIAAATCNEEVDRNKHVERMIDKECEVASPDLEGEAESEAVLWWWWLLTRSTIGKIILNKDCSQTQ